MGGGGGGTSLVHGTTSSMECVPRVGIDLNRNDRTLMKGLCGSQTVLEPTGKASFVQELILHKTSEKTTCIASVLSFPVVRRMG